MEGQRQRQRRWVRERPVPSHRRWRLLTRLPSRLRARWRATRALQMRTLARPWTRCSGAIPPAWPLRTRVLPVAHRRPMCQSLRMGLVTGRSRGPLTDCCLQLTSCTPQARVRRGRAAPGGRARCVPLGPAGGAGEDQKVPRGGWRQAAAVAAATVGRRSGCPCVLEGGMLSCA